MVSCRTGARSFCAQVLWVKFLLDMYQARLAEGEQKEEYT